MDKLAERGQWLTRSEAAARCRLCERSFSQRVKEKRLPAGKSLGRRLLWDPAEIDAAIRGIQNGPVDPIMAAIHAAEAQAAAKRRAHQG